MAGVFLGVAFFLLHLVVSLCVRLCVTVSACSDAWTDSVALLHVDSAALVSKHVSTVISELTQLSSLSQVLLRR